MSSKENFPVRAGFKKLLTNGQVANLPRQIPSPFTLYPPLLTMTDDSFNLVIEAGRTERQYWQDLWRYRELFLFPGVAGYSGAL